MPRSICRSTVECTAGISWRLGQELSSELSWLIRMQWPPLWKEFPGEVSVVERKKKRCWRKIWRETWRCVSTTASAGIENLTWIPYLVVNKGKKSRSVGGPLSISVRIANDALQDTETEMRSQYGRRRRLSIDKWPENKMQEEKKLEEFRSFRTSKRQKKEKQRSDDEKKLKLRIVLFVWQKLKWETKQPSCN